MWPQTYCDWFGTGFESRCWSECPINGWFREGSRSYWRGSRFMRCWTRSNRLLGDTSLICLRPFIQITVWTFNKATMEAIGIPFTWYTTCVCMLCRWRSRRVCITCSFLCNIHRHCMGRTYVGICCCEVTSTHRIIIVWTSLGDGFAQASPKCHFRKTDSNI